MQIQDEKQQIDHNAIYSTGIDLFQMKEQVFLNPDYYLGSEDLCQHCHSILWPVSCEAWDWI